MNELWLETYWIYFSTQWYEQLDSNQVTITTFIFNNCFRGIITFHHILSFNNFSNILYLFPDSCWFLTVRCMHSITLSLESFAFLCNSSNFLNVHVSHTYMYVIYFLYNLCYHTDMEIFIVLIFVKFFSLECYT